MVLTSCMMASSSRRYGSTRSASTRLIGITGMRSMTRSKFATSVVSLARRLCRRAASTATPPPCKLSWTLWKRRRRRRQRQVERLRLRLRSLSHLQGAALQRQATETDQTTSWLRRRKKTWLGPSANHSKSRKSRREISHLRHPKSQRKHPRSKSQKLWTLALVQSSKTSQLIKARRWVVMPGQLRQSVLHQCMKQLQQLRQCRSKTQTNLTSTSVVTIRQRRQQEVAHRRQPTSMTCSA